MGIWLKEAMQIEPFALAELIAGKNGLDRLVTATNIQEVPNVDKWLYGGEIVFTSGYAFEGIKEVCNLLERLDKKGVAALVIKTGQFFSEIPVEIINKANQINFPLFRLPEETPYMDCIIPIMIRITNNEQYQISRTERLQKQLFQIVIENKGLNSICNLLSQYIHRPIFILSPKGQLLGSTKRKENDNSQNLFYSECNLFLKQNKISKLILNDFNIISLPSQYKAICAPVYARNECIAYLFIDRNTEDISSTDLVALKSSIGNIAIILLQEKSIMDAEYRLHAQLLEDLLSKKYSDIDIILRRLSYVGFDTSGKYFVIEIGPDEFEKTIKQKLINFSESDIQSIKNDINELILNSLQRINRRVLSMENGVETTVLLSIKNENERYKYRKLFGDILDELKKHFPKICFSAGFGRTAQNIEDIERSWNEAKISKQAGKTINQQNYRRITMFEELGCMSFLYKTLDSDEIKSYYQEYLEPLNKYDEINDAQLVKTLSVYFENNQNMNRTAESLFIHKNTVIYRLKKIEDILGESLNNHEISFNLQMCLRIKMML